MERDLYSRDPREIKAAFDVFRLFTNIEVISEIHRTGDSETFGTALREYDTLFTQSLDRDLTEDERTRLTAVEGQLKGDLGDGFASVYSSWRNEQDLRKEQNTPIP